MIQAELDLAAVRGRGGAEAREPALGGGDGVAVQASRIVEAAAPLGDLAAQLAKRLPGGAARLDDVGRPLSDGLPLRVDRDHLRVRRKGRSLRAGLRRSAGRGLLGKDGAGDERGCGEGAQQGREAGDLAHWANTSGSSAPGASSHSGTGSPRSRRKAGLKSFD